MQGVNQAKIPLLTPCLEIQDIQSKVVHGTPGKKVCQKELSWAIL